MEHRRTCPVCAGVVWRTLTRKGLDLAGEAVRYCTRCSAVFLSPHMDPEETHAYYEGEYSRRYRGGETPTPEALARRDQVAAERFALLRPLLAPGRQYLEIGCGAGNFLALLGRTGGRALGIEPARGYAACGHERGLSIRIGTFPEADTPPGKYDGVFLFHVLEHIPYPRPFLEAVRSRLKPGGFVAVEVPDLLRALEGRFRHRYFQRPHLVDYHRGTLTYLLAECGFAVTAVHYGPPTRPHHLLVVAKPGPAEAVLPPPGFVTHTWRRLRRRVLWSQWLAQAGRLLAPRVPYSFR